MAKVYVKESSYEYYKDLREDVFELLDSVGTIEKGMNVLIKPNLLMTTTPDSAITTHPLIVKAAVEFALGKSARVLVSDSPAIGRFDKVVKQTGILDALSGMDVALHEFKTARNVEDSKFKRLELAEEALDADVIINLPKLKTHVQMGITLAVKNLFGTVLGLQKSSWHMKIGENKDKFAELLLQIYDTLRPQINLLDGISALEGEGPGTSGRARHVGILMASSDALSIDMTACEMLSVAPFSFATNKAANQVGLLEDYSVIGKMPKVENFDFPKNTSIMFGPKFARPFIRKNLTSRPQNISDNCKLCSECVNICPAKAIENTGHNLVFNYNKCIRCYCCLEICPHKAIKVYEPLVGKVVRKFL